MIFFCPTSFLKSGSKTNNSSKNFQFWSLFLLRTCFIKTDILLLKKLLKPLKLQFNVFSIKMLKERQNIMIQMIELFSISFPSKTKISPVSALREKCPYFEFFQSVFSCIYPSSVRMGEITDQKNSESGHFLCSAGI